jgi:hypothetical protein
LELTAYRLRHDVDWPLRPARLHRDWMDGFEMRWPYRCLPMVVANQAGWELHCPVSVEVEWNGGPGVHDLKVRHESKPEVWASMIGSHFGGGILTFSIPYLFRTPEPVGLFVRGACNFWVAGAVPLDGWVECWGLEAPFTMNWKITDPARTVRFQEGDPICLIQPFDARRLEEARPKVRSIGDDAALAERFEAWRQGRLAFEGERSSGQSQHAYTKGDDATGARVAGHLTRLDLREFEED